MIHHHTKGVNFDTIRGGSVGHTIADDLIGLFAREQPELPLGAASRDQIRSAGQNGSWPHI